MTQSGQGEEPSARPAREGIVLPSDGGEPLLPGTAGGYGPAPVPAAPPAAPRPSAPPGGQEWGTPWGPEQHTAPPPAQGQPWGAQGGQPWGEPERTYPAQDHWGGSQDAAGAHAAQQLGGYGAGPQPGSYGHGDPAGAPMPAPQQPYGGAPLPPAGAGTPYPPQGYGAPLPPVDEGATQFIPPVTGPPAGPDEQATRFIPPVPAAPVDEGATQFLPPVGPGALPPEAAGESTQVLGRARHQGGAGPMPPASGADAAPTQFLPPVTGQPSGAAGQRRPPSDFDSLFRGGPGGAGAAPATQHMPRVQDARPQQGAHGGARPPRGPRGGAGRGGRGGGRTGSRVPLIAAVGVGIVVLGIGAGALLAGGEDTGRAGGGEPVAASAPAGQDASPSPSPSATTADPAEQQAVALDKLLADSGASRTAVIKAVADVKSCDNLGQAGQNLRAAAAQRNRLVTDLAKLKVDLLPGNAALTTALNKAWRASAAADNHYAAWAGQVAGNKKLCKKGQARPTSRTQAGNRESGTASREKQTAAQLWNAVARKYALTERQPVQL